MNDRVADSQLRTIVAPDPADLARLLADAGVPSARPVIVLIGGATKLDDRGPGELASIVRDGVVATAEALGAVIVDGGTNAGVMALAGQARRELEAKVQLIGVAPVGRVAVAGVETASGTTELEPNHSLVILAPGNEWGAELPLMMQAARVISDGKPVAAVLIDGGPVALTEAMEVRANGWPVIVIGGSGRSADLLVKAAGGDGSVLISEMAGGAAALASMLRPFLEGTRMSEQPRAAAGTTTAAQPDKVEYPALYTTASEASKRGRRLSKALAAFELLFALTGLAVAILITILHVENHAQEMNRDNISVFAMAGSFLVALVLRLVGHATGYEEDWLTGRSIAEGVKSSSWRYMMRAEPYAGEDADEQFGGDLQTYMSQANDIRQAVDRVGRRPQQISASMRRVRELDQPGRLKVYIEDRLLNQADWYARKSSIHRRRATQYFWLGLVLQVAAAVTALYAVHLSGSMASSLTILPGIWVIPQTDVSGFLLRVMSLTASAAIAMTAWSLLNRNDEVARAYADTFQQLALIADHAEKVKTEEGLARVVTDGEETIGRENRAWVAKRAERYDSPEFAHGD